MVLYTWRYLGKNGLFRDSHGVFTSKEDAMKWLGVTYKDQTEDNIYVFMQEGFPDRTFFLSTIMDVNPSMMEKCNVDQ